MENQAVDADTTGMSADTVRELTNQTSAPIQ